MFPYATVIFFVPVIPCCSVRSFDIPSKHFIFFSVTYCRSAELQFQFRSAPFCVACLKWPLWPTRRRDNTASGDPVPGMWSQPEPESELEPEPEPEQHNLFTGSKDLDTESPDLDHFIGVVARVGAGAGAAPRV